jgi:non-lysosomal glucosylceramidase
MTGFEYAAACAMIQNSLIEEGLAVVKAVRDRYDGKRRNPWNEIECGSNYARAMASYALLNAFSGFTFDLTRGMIGFKPVVPGEFRCFWGLGHAWGELGQSGNTAQLSVLHGQLEVKELHVHGVPVAVECNQRVLGFSLGDLGGIHLEQPLVMTKGDVLRIGCEA